MRKTWVTIAGWTLVVLGLAALVLPGPGLLLLLSGLVVLSQEYDWAERRVEPVKQKAFDVAKAGVASYPRILMSALGASALIAVGIYWGLDNPIPEVGPLGPALPFGGWPTGISIIVSGLIAMSLLAYSVKRWHRQARHERRHGTTLGEPTS
ncbi:MAG: PGPGW domain-containing protein [Nocardioidaceae bacterium]